MQNQTKTRKMIYVFLVTMILFVVQSFASKFGGLIADLFNYTMIDQDDIFMHISVHHAVQMIIALLIIFIIAKTKKIKFHLKPKVDKTGILYTTIFTIVILLYVFISYIIGYCKDDHRLAITLAAMLFSIAHIKWTVLPFAVSFSWVQLIYAFVLGVIYGVTYIKSKSIIYPMIMHGLSNFLMVGVGYMFAIVME